MGKLILYTGVSLDGFIAAEGDDLAWLDAFGSDASLGDEYNAFYSTIDTVVMGNGTYQWVVKAGHPDPYSGKPSYVYTRNETPPESPYVTYINEDPVAFTRKLKSETDGNIWLVGGGKINGLLLAAGLIDELQLDMMPVALGMGTRIFEGYACEEQFDLTSSTAHDSGRLRLIYNRKG